MTPSALAIALAALLHHTGAEAMSIAASLAAACGDDLACVADGAVYLEAESGWQRSPHPYSTDAKAGQSCGELQTPCAVPAADRVRYWVRLRAWSLATCGDLTGLASGRCGRARRLAAERAFEARLLSEVAARGER
jgi:hypothetical protein